MDQNEFELENAKSMAWERDAINRLYYGLWIVFLGGFVLSLHVIVYRYFRLAIILVFAFRLFAVVGTAINFWMQYHAIAAASTRRESLFHKAFGQRVLSEKALEKSMIYDQTVGRCEKYLRFVGAAFLLIAFAGSFLVHLP